MAKKGKKGKKGKRKQKTYSLSDSIGGGAALILQVNDYKLLNDAGRNLFDQDMLIIANPVNNLVGYNSVTKTWDLKAAKVGKVLLAATLVKTIAPKVPFIKGLPKRIPLVGKYLRW